ncbi:MAG: TonB C-terminal domain-containing protein [Candidatus Sulfotelmatobacter sp.]|jgi:TonB-like protein
MKTLSMLLLLRCALAFGQSTPTPPAQQKVPNQDFGLAARTNGDPSGNIEILSDTQGVDFSPYLRHILPTIRENWFRLIPQSAETRKGKLAIEFAITKDGKVTNMRLVATSGVVALDRPAWGSIIASNPFPPLPTEFPGPFLALRLRFSYNPDKHDLSVIEVSISVPGKLEVPVGGSEVVTATVKGTNEKTVEWMVTGSGCSGTACGEIKGGLYVAPSILPEPPLVTLTAISKADPKARASVDVRIVQPAPSH